MDFFVEQNRETVKTFDDPALAITDAEQRFAQSGTAQPVTIGVVNEDNDAIASLSNRRITGVFTKQEPRGRKDIVQVGEISFDATDHVLLLPLDELRELQDSDQTTDEIGRAHVQWDGPCEVAIVDSVREFFGVDALEDLTQQNLDYVRARIAPQPTRTEQVAAGLTLTLQVAPGADVDAFLRQLRPTFDHEFPGIIVSEARLDMLEQTKRTPRPAR